MSTLLRGGRAGRGGGRVGNRSTNGSEDDGRGRSPASRTRANGYANGIKRGSSRTLQHRAQGLSAPRGPKNSTPSTYGRNGGASNGSSATARNTSSTGSTSGSYEERFNKLKEMRKQEIAYAIAHGLMGDPDQPQDLKNAITTVGTCQDLCPEFERMERITQKDAKPAEMVVGEDGKPTQKVDESRMVKRFGRSAAGKGDQPPSELRPPVVLKRTVDYLFDTLINESGLATNQTFIWDRTRAIRNDFSIQQVTSTSDLRLAIECYEQIARFHVVSMHYVGTLPESQAPGEYNYQQDREQFDKTLLSLLRYYDKVRDRYRSPHEPELRACWIIFQIQNNISDLDDQVQTWPADLIRNPKIQHALSVYAAACEVIDGKGPFVGRARTNILIAQQNWGRFWKLVGSKQISYLLSCVAELQFNTIRRIALHTILSAHQPGNRVNQDWTLNDMRRMLAFDSKDETQDFLQHYRIQVTEKEDPEHTYVDFSTVPERSLPAASNDMPPQYFSNSLVERKRYGRTATAIIRGLTVTQARQQKMIEEPEESLFVGELSEEEKVVSKPTKKVQFNPEVSSFTPSAPIPSPPSINFSGFGQPSTSSSSAPSAFGQPSTGARAFGQPSTFGTTSTPQPSSSFGQKPLAPATNGKGGFNFGGVSTTTTTPSASPFAPSNGSSAKQPSILDLGHNSLLKSQAANDSKTPSFGAPSNGFGFPSLQPAGRDNGASMTPGVQTTTTSKNSSSSASQPSALGASFTDGTASSSALGLSASMTSKPIGATPPSFSGFPKASNSHIAASTPLFSPQTSKITQEPTRSSTDTAAQIGATPQLPQTSSHDQLGTPAKPPQPAQKPDTSAAPFSTTTKPAIEAAKSPEAPNGKVREVAAWDYVARQLLLNPTQGFLKQYVEHVAAPMIVQAIREHEEEMDREKADGFRWQVLARRYFFWWKWSASEMRDKRIGRERRERLAAEKKAKAQRAKEEEAQKKTEELRKREELLAREDREFDTFRRNLDLERQKSRPQLELEHGLFGQQQSTLLNGNETLALPTIGSVNKSESINSREGRTSVRSHKRSRTQPDASSMMPPPKNTSHRVEKAPRQSSPTLSNASTSSNRSSILGISMLSGASLLDSLGVPVGTRLSTMTSNYFNNKALGLQPVFSKTQSRLAQAGMKRARASDEFNASVGSTTENSPPGRKKRFEPTLSTPTGNRFTEQHTSPETPLLATSTSSQAANILPEDEALFARVRAVTQAMGQSMTDLKENMAKDELRQSHLGSSHGSNSPNIRLNGSGSSRPCLAESTSSLFNSLPAYMSRPSRFVPREDYGKRPQKKPYTPQDSAKGKSNTTTANGSTSMNGSTPSSRQRQQGTNRPPPAPPPKKSVPVTDVIDLDSD
ncbi:hypothetical protein FKW77_004455 [Venturia effusa]|uniref:SAC3/GANP/THP3 conserved domain-containing protein n=1 Tax=Venturia effusa TaxID=50376 RepID=A0A517L368_9PEZI|nr:hypothetical protein FKW77_004455 [Venturia effusa]